MQPPIELFDHLDYRNIDKEEQQRRCTASAHKALLEYDLKDYKITPVQNYLGEYKWCVESTSELYLLIMSYPVKIWDFAPTRQHLRSQLLWMYFLESATDITMQTPQKNKSDDLVTTVKLLDGNLQCALLKWVEGDDISEPSISEAKSLGKISAQIHSATKKWQPKEEITRRTIDQNTLKDTLATLQQLAHSGHIDSNRFSILHPCLTKALTLWQETPMPSSSIVHSDFHAHNCIKHQNDLRPIDFEGSNIAPQLWDLAISLRSWKKTDLPHQDHVNAFLNAYASIIPLDTKHIALTEAFIVWSMIDKAWAKKGNNPRLNFSRYEAFKNSMFDRFLADKSFLFPKNI